MRRKRRRRARRKAGESYWAIVLTKIGIDPHASPRTKRRLLVVTVVVALLSATTAFVIQYALTEPTIRKEIASQKEYDADQVPFTVSVRPERDEPPFWVMVLDRELTADEARTMTSTEDSSAAFAYLLDLGAHPLQYAPPLENAPPGYGDPGVIDFVDVFKINVMSTRAYSVVINDWEVTDVRCVRSTAKTVVALPPQGGMAYEGIRLHIPPRAGEPVLTDNVEGQGEPYFANRYIEVGGGQPAGGLRVEAIAALGQSCEWGVTVHYGDVHQSGRNVPLTDSEGDPVRIRTESVPDDPVQKWVFGAVPWTACHENSEEPLCALV